VTAVDATRVGRVTLRCVVTRRRPGFCATSVWTSTVTTTGTAAATSPLLLLLLMMMMMMMMTMANL